LDLTGIRRLRIGRLTVTERVAPTIRRLIWRTFGPHYTPVDVNGHGMYLSDETDDAQPPVPDMVLGRFDRELSGWLTAFLQPGMNVIDIGAHIGYFVLMAARRVGPAGRIWAFEPAPENFRLLVRNIDLNRYTNVIAVPKAICNRSGTVSFFLSDTGSGSHSLHADEWTRHEVSVAATTLDEFLEGEGWPHVDLVKMDIQGAEKAALDGGQRFLARNRPLIMILEFWPDGLRAAGADPEELLVWLADLGFTLQWTPLGGAPEPVHPRRLMGALGAGEYTNLLCEVKATS
jgi:FkbM family methyltransferase